MICLRCHTCQLPSSDMRPIALAGRKSSFFSDLETADYSNSRTRKLQSSLNIDRFFLYLCRLLGSESGSTCFVRNHGLQVDTRRFVFTRRRTDGAGGFFGIERMSKRVESSAIWSSGNSEHRGNIYCKNADRVLQIGQIVPRFQWSRLRVATPPGFEPGTFSLEGCCSIP